MISFLAGVVLTVAIVAAPCIVKTPPRFGVPVVNPPAYAAPRGEVPKMPSGRYIVAVIDTPVGWMERP